VGVLEPSGTTAWPKERIDATSKHWSVAFASPERALGLVVSGPADEVADSSTVLANDGVTVVLDGELQDALDQPGWKPTGFWRGYARFGRTSIRPPVWVAGPAGNATVRQVATTEWGTETDAVRAEHPVIVVRSEAYQTGWRVVAAPTSGPARHLPVFRDGLVQAVRVPAGSWTLTFLYQPKGLTAAEAASGLGGAGLLVAVLGGWRRRRVAADVLDQVGAREE
jgi:hypothetical protein